jgi:lysophospholipid acyltransferase (LPLAT)-like uncharacterized protein
VSDGRNESEIARAAPADWVGRLGPPLLRTLYASWRVRCEGSETLESLTREEPGWLLAVWHGKLITLLPHFGPRYGPLFTMISQSRDGDRIASVAEPLGVVPLRGSTSRGGSRALLQAVRLLRQGRAGAHIVDGPRGPAREIKPGLMLMAQRSGAPILPIHAASSWRWVAKRSWDRMEVPLPFSRVLIRVGQPHHVPRNADASQIEQMRKQLEQEMQLGNAAAEAELRGTR